MSWNSPVLGQYCERGLDPAFWAEPLNALSNIGFLIVSGLMLRRAGREIGDRNETGLRSVQGLALLTGVIGIGSFLFHTFASRWSLLADVIPIMIFMAAYLALALRVYLRMSWGTTAALVVAFMAVTMNASRLLCPATTVVLAGAARNPCLNGSVGYVPALLALVAVGLASGRDHPARRDLLVAAGIFGVSIALRSVDRDICPLTLLFGRGRGTHALWHLLNALTLWMLLLAALRTAKAGPGRS
jgi:hypothetical protein